MMLLFSSIVIRKNCSRSVRRFWPFSWTTTTPQSVQQSQVRGAFNFDSLPLEVLFQIFELSTPEDLSRLCALNRIHFDRVASYLNSERFIRRFHRVVFNSSLTRFDASNGIVADFPPIALARLFRTISQKGCAKFIIQLYLKVEQGLTDVNKNFWGRLITEISWDWSQQEFFAFMKEFSASTGLGDRVNRLFNGEIDGSYKKTEEELLIRRVIRSLFLDFSSPSRNGFELNGGNTQQLSFRLSAVLQLFAKGESHRMMLLLAAPINKQRQGNDIEADFIDYHHIVTEPIFDHQSAHTFLGELPRSLEKLLFTNTLELKELRWSELEIFNFIELLTTYPEPWVLRNFASLLVLAPGISRVAIYIRALHGDPAEAGNTLFSCVEASILLGLNANVALRDTISALVSKCSTSVCMTVLREAIATTNQMTLEAIGGNGGQANADELDLVNLKNALETNRQIAELFLTKLHHLF